jgi:hypothetical protein
MKSEVKPVFEMKAKDPVRAGLGHHPTGFVREGLQGFLKIHGCIYRVNRGERLRGISQTARGAGA